MPLIISSLYVWHCVCVRVCRYIKVVFLGKFWTTSWTTHLHFYWARPPRLGPTLFLLNNDSFCRCWWAIQDICINCKSSIRTHIWWGAWLSTRHIAPLATIAWTTSGTSVLHTVPQWLTRRPWLTNTVLFSGWLARASRHTNSWLIFTWLARKTFILMTILFIQWNCVFHDKESIS